MAYRLVADDRHPSDHTRAHSRAPDAPPLGRVKMNDLPSDCNPPRCLSQLKGANHCVWSHWWALLKVS